MPAFRGASGEPPPAGVSHLPLNPFNIFSPIPQEASVQTKADVRHQTETDCSCCAYDQYEEQTDREFDLLRGKW